MNLRAELERRAKAGDEVSQWALRCIEKAYQEEQSLTATLLDQHQQMGMLQFAHENLFELFHQRYSAPFLPN